MHICDSQWKVHTSNLFTCKLGSQATLQSILTKFEESINIWIHRIEVQVRHSRQKEDDVSNVEYTPLNLDVNAKEHIYLFGLCIALRLLLWL